MRICFVAAALAAGLGFAAPAALAEQPRPTPAVTVIGEASVAVQADTAIITTGVTSQGKTAREASEANARAMTSVLGALKDAGIADADIQTSRISLQPQHEPSRAGSANRIVGFQASNQVSVRLREIDKVSDTIDRAVGAGANVVSGVEFLVADPSKALDKVRLEGLADARRKADIYAKAAGAGLGHALAIQEQTAPQGFLHAARAGGPPTPIAVGEETLHFSITVTYQLLY